MFRILDGGPKKELQQQQRLWVLSLLLRTFQGTQYDHCRSSQSLSEGPSKTPKCGALVLKLSLQRSLELSGGPHSRPSGGWVGLKHRLACCTAEAPYLRTSLTWFPVSARSVNEFGLCVVRWLCAFADIASRF